MAVSPGEPAVIAPPADLRITNVALGDELEDENSRTSVKLTYRGPGGSEDSDEDEEEAEEEQKRYVGHVHGRQRVFDHSLQLQETGQDC